MPGMPVVPSLSFFLYAMLMVMMTSFAELLVLHTYTHIIQYSALFNTITCVAYIHTHYSIQIKICSLYQEERIWSQVKKWKRRKLSNIVLEIIV